MKTRNLLRGLLSLSLLVVIAGCGSDDKVNALPSDKNDVIGSTKMSKIYNELYDELGSAAAFDKVLLEIAKNSIVENVNYKRTNIIKNSTIQQKNSRTSRSGCISIINLYISLSILRKGTLCSNGQCLKLKYL